MKIKIWLLAPVLAVASAAPSQDPSDYENPGVFERNQVEPHATLMPYMTFREALEGKRKESPDHLTLNGTWKFNWSENLSSAPEGFQKPGYNHGAWQEIKVPSNWQMEGFGYPLFRNVGLPHPLDPPRVPDDFNPVGCYFRSFEIPGSWKEKQVFLHFEGVQSASYVWMNGKEVGYNQGGMEPAEYDVTPFLRKGENSIAVMVLRYCDGSYLEDQDTWRLSGIFRDVYLMATPGVHVRDFYVTTDLDSSYHDAMLELKAEIANFRQQAVRDHELEAGLYDPNGMLIGDKAATLETGRVEAGSLVTLAGSWKIYNPLKWSAEYPNLYTLVLTLRDEEGRALEHLSCRVGFREVEVKDQAILVNGIPVKFNGVNSHMLHPRTGHAMDTATMRKDLETMKRFNINCVRTSHYPPNVEYLDLADELGIYIVDETGDEAHAYTYLSSMPEWRDQYLDRMRKMVYRDRNHPSVVIWSAGNESGPGDNICALIDEGHRIDPSRPAWMYGGNRDEDPETNPILCEDIVGPRYPDPFRLEQRFGKSDDPRPSFMDEYIAATGNSLGGLEEYWDLIRRYRRLTGGAIWDWISPGITMPVITTKDESPGEVMCTFMNRAHLVEGESGQALSLSGHDDWLEVYRDPSLDITGEALTISFKVNPGPYNGTMDFLTKGDYQYGIVQSDQGHLEFYLNTGRRQSLSGRLPEDWTGKWHHVTGIYDGKKMELYLDGRIIGTQSCKGSILNSPYSVVLGKSAEMEDSHRGYMCHALLDEVRIFGEVIAPDDLINGEGEDLKPRSRLWLDFETSEENGEYWSVGIPGRTYGLVWPDRTIQPELWQLKKTPQPVAVKAVDLLEGVFEVRNLYDFRNLKELKTIWQVTDNGTVVREGELDLQIPPGQSERVRIPSSGDVTDPGAAAYLLVSFRTRKDQPWAPAGHEVAWEQFELPRTQPSGAAEQPGFLSPEPPPMVSAGLRMEETDSSVVFTGATFSYRFDRKTGMLASMVIGGREIVHNGLIFNVWRAPLANERDPWNAWRTEMGYTRDWMGHETSNGWYSLGLDHLLQSVNLMSYAMEGENGRVTVEASLFSEKQIAGFRVRYGYTISPGGEIILETEVSPGGNQPRWLPKMGLQMTLPETFHNLEWFGRGPFETYPDRKTGAKIGLYTSTAEKEYVPYIIPQDYGNKTDVRWLKLTDDSGTGIMVTGAELFNTSLQKFSTGHLDRARYTFQLENEGIVTLNLDHRVSGVGCTAISVLNPYRVYPEDTSFTFRISPVMQN